MSDRQLLDAIDEATDSRLRRPVPAASRALPDQVRQRARQLLAEAGWLGRRGALPGANDWRRGASGCIELRSAHQRRAGGGSPFDDRGELRSCTSRTIWDWFIGLS